ncbi:MAG: hypothetical protein IRZ16_24310 [Myxococcaceae bacterium]|nr:hypothetical protein [Myxococcaceae bacterium]
MFASEELDADALGALARPGVVLWLRTRSNTLSPAVSEKLRRFEEAWVEVRPPLRPTQLDALAKAPRAGLWLRNVADLGPAVTRLGVRRLAVDVVGNLDEATGDRVRAAGVDRVRWSPAAIDLESFARFAQMPAQKSLVLLRGASIPRCEARSVEVLAMVEVLVPPPEVPALASCGFGARVPVEPDVDESVLSRIFQQMPTAELEVQVGADDRRAMRTRQLLERLEAASGIPRRARGSSNR